VAVPGTAPSGLAWSRLVDAEAAARCAGLDDGVAWSSVRAIVAQDADSLAGLRVGAGALADEAVVAAALGRVLSA
jgi:hypothetical protein